MEPGDLARLRRQYADIPLSESQLAADPFTQFARWFDDVLSVPDAILEPNAMVLATTDGDGQPSARTVLLKAFDDNGFVLFTNLHSRKAREALATRKASLVFPWHHIERQVVVVGAVELTSHSQSAEYFAQRPRPSRLAAWASRQSEVVADRRELEQRFQEVEQRFAEGDVPLPDFWGGLRIVPDTVEFWHGRSDRLHDRLRYRRATGGWVIERLNP